MKKIKQSHKNKYKKVETFFYPEERLDFHYFDKFDAFEIEKDLNIFLEDQYNWGRKYLLVIVGRGFVIRPFVQKLLEKHSLVDKFTKASIHNGGEGAFEITLVS